MGIKLTNTEKLEAFRFASTWIGAFEGHSGQTIEGGATDVDQEALDAFQLINSLLEIQERVVIRDEILAKLTKGGKPTTKDREAALAKGREALKVSKFPRLISDALQAELDEAAQAKADADAPAEEEEAEVELTADDVNDLPDEDEDEAPADEVVEIDFTDEADTEGESDTPTEAWTAPEIRDFAKENGINLKGATKKGDMLSTIADALVSA